MAGTRLMARVAWSDVRRNKWRSALVVLMIALPIAGLTAAGFIVATMSPSPEEYVTGELGEADLRISQWDGSMAADDVVALFPDGTDSTLVYGWMTRTIVGGASRSVTVFDAAPDDPVVGSMFDLAEGRAPQTATEIAVSPTVMDQFDATVGDTISLGERSDTFRIVGVAVTPERLHYPIGLVTPGSLSDEPAAGLVGLYLALPGDASPETVMRVIERNSSVIQSYLPRFGLSQDSDSSAGGFGSGFAFFGASLGITALVLLETGLIAAAAFVVGARRQLRTIGLIGAIGGEPRHIRHLVLSAGALLGLTGSVAGAVIGTSVAVALIPFYDRWAGRITGALEVPVPILVGGLVLGTVAATLAALVPARTASKVHTVDALAGRAPEPRPSGRLARSGLVAAVAGSVSVAVGTPIDSDLLVGAGLVAIVGGLLFTIPALVALVGRAAKRFPLPMRIAARDTARHGRRTSAAVAAAAVALMIPVAAATVTLSNEARGRENPPLTENHLLIRSGSASDASSHTAAAALAAELTNEVFPDAVVARYAAGAMDPESVPEDYRSDPGFGGPDLYPGFVQGDWVELGDGNLKRPSEVINVGDATLLEALGAGEYIDDLDAGKVIVFNEGVMVGDATSFEAPFGPHKFDEDSSMPLADNEALIPAVNASTGAFRTGSLPGAVISQARAAELGLTERFNYRTVLRAAEPITSAQLDEAREIASRHPGMYVVTAEDMMPDAAPVRNAALGMSAAIALGIVAVAVALVAAESRRDQAILTAMGAGPLTRRHVVGSSALLLAAVAAIVAVPAGFIPASIIQLSSNEGYPFVVPWVAIGGVTFVVPAVAGLVAASVSRTPPAAQLLRPVE